MVREIVKYNPAFLSAQELVDSFVVRHAELDSIVRVVRENVTQSNQHILVIGPRGIGKTMLVLRAAEEVRRDEELSKRWYPLVFSEESYRVGTCGEFWLEALFHLGQQTKDERWKRTYKELRDEQDDGRLRDRALAQLMDFADGQGKRILLVVENLNMLLGEQLGDTEGWALRHTLLNEPRVMLLASATSRFEQVETEGKAMFELFRFIELKPLDEGECKALWQSVTGSESDDGRIRPLQILTGGNPRLMAIVSSFAAKVSLRELMQDLMQLVDENTEYFKSHLDNLPAVERKVYLALAEIWEPAGAKRVAEAARLNVNKASSLLKRLITRGAVVEADGKGHAKEYYVAERMYNVYYLMRRRGAPSSRVKAVVNFMAGFYGPEQLADALKNIAEETSAMAPDERGDHYAAFAGILPQVLKNGLDALIELARNIPKDFTLAVDAPEEIKVIGGLGLFADIGFTDKDSIETFSLALQSIREGRWEEAENLTRAMIEKGPDSFVARHMRASALYELGQLEQAEQELRRVIDIEEEKGLNETFFGKSFAERKGTSGELVDSVMKFLPSMLPTPWFALIYLLIRRKGDTGEVLSVLSRLLEQRELVSSSLDMTVALLVGLAAHNLAREVLDIVAGSASAGVLEPLVVGLRLYLGEDVKAPIEIMEVAKDVVKRIEQRRDEMTDAESSSG